MSFSTEIITALIGVVSALGMVVIRDVFLNARNERREHQRTLLQVRLEQVYVPLEYLAFKLLQSDASDEKAQLSKEIGTILRNYGHLLSEETSAAFYTLLEDENSGALLLEDQFDTELDQLKEQFYRQWHSKRPRSTRTKFRNRRRVSDISVEEVDTIQAPVIQWGKIGA